MFETVAQTRGIPQITSPEEETWYEVVQRQVEGLKFGSVQITVHDGRVVQVETSVKVRFEKR